MAETVTENSVSYWAVDGDRWCNVDGLITAELAEKWQASGWRIVTIITEHERPVYGEKVRE